jgi:hypothetical protein
MNNTASKTTKKIDQGKDEKKKKLDKFGYYLAWGSFAAGLIAAFVTLAKKTDTPKKDDYYI